MTDRNEQPPLHDLPLLLRGPEVATVMRVSNQHVRRLARSGALPASRISGDRSEWLYDKRRILAVIEGGDPWADLPPLLSDAPEVLTAAETAEFLRLSHPFVVELANEGAIGGFRTKGDRGDWRFNRRRIAALAVPTNRQAGEVSGGGMTGTGGD